MEIGPRLIQITFHSGNCQLLGAEIQAPKFNIGVQIIYIFIYKKERKKKRKEERSLYSLPLYSRGFKISLRSNKEKVKRNSDG